MKNREVLRLRPLTTAQGEEVGLFLPLEVLDRNGYSLQRPNGRPHCKGFIGGLSD
jgi:hypothetical protein